MSDAKQEILDRIRTALADRPNPAPVERSYRNAGSAGPASDGDRTGNDQNDSGPAGRERAGDAVPLLELLVDRLVDYKATVHRATAQTAAEVIAAAVSERGAQRLVVPEGFPAELLSRLAQVPIRDDPALTPAELDGSDGVLTLSRVAIAETGTIVLDAGPGQGRRAVTLVPDYHLCVVAAADVVRGVPEAVAVLDSARPLTWISGPSATSDIELQRVEGVHGPRTLAVVLISD